jgi:small-conductance mechanosensitive channel
MHSFSQQVLSRTAAKLLNSTVIENTRHDDTKHLLKVVAAWVTIVYIICYDGVALIPDVRSWFMHYALHTNANMGENIITLATLVSGLVIWNVVGVLGAWLFAVLHNAIKRQLDTGQL